MLITAAKFAELAVVSRAAVSKSPPTKIHKEPDGKIDTDHPVNAMYLAEHGAAREAPAKPAAKAKRQPRKPDAEDAAFQADVLARLAKKETAAAKRKVSRSADSDRGEDEGEDLEDDDIEKFLEMIKAEGGSTVLVLKKMKADIAYKEAATARYHLELETKKGNLVPKTLFLTAVQGINKAIDDHLHRVPAKTGPVVFSMARREGATELEVIRALEVDMGAAIRRATEDVARLAQ